MRLSDLLPTEGVFGNDDPALISISGVCEHTDKIKEGMLFIAKRGIHTDATRLLDEIETKGASAILLAEGSTLPRETALPCFYAEDIALTEAKIWERYYGDPAKSLRIFGVTGTNGKTSTAEFLSHILNEFGIPTAYIGTLGIRFRGVTAKDDTMTTPPSEVLYRELKRLVNLGAKAVVMEVSSHAASQGRVALLRFEALLFTNLTEDHLDYHGSMENYFSAKRSLFAQADLAIINKDDDYGQRLLEELSIKKKSVAVIESADYTVSDLHENGYKSTQYNCVSAFGEFSVYYPFFGSFHVYNTLLAIAAALSAGVCQEEIRRALFTLKPPKGRLEVLSLPKECNVIIDYAHTPDAMLCAIKAVKRLTRGRLFVLFGAGGEREREKRPKMGYIAASLATYVFLTTDNPRCEAQSNIFADILAGMKDKENYTVIEDRTLAIRTALDRLSTGDTLLLLGKGHEEYLLVGEEKRFFSEREIVRDYWKEKTGE